MKQLPIQNRKSQKENKECNWEENNIIIKNVLEKATHCAARRARACTTHNTVSRTHETKEANENEKQQHEKAAGSLCIDDQKKSQGKSNPSRLWHFLAAAWQTRLVSIYRPAA